jgi:prepilin-type N-terminal cleavage/methylation domain-containing protein
MKFNIPLIKKKIPKSKSNKTGNEGFTLIELMICISIIGILAATTITSSSKVRNERAVGLVADQLISDIRNVQNLALAGGLAPFTSADNSGIDSKPPCAFGIKFEPPTKYKIVYIMQNDTQNTSQKACGNKLDDIITTNITDLPKGQTDIQSIDNGLSFSIANPEASLILFILPGGNKFDWNNINPNINDTKITIVGQNGINPKTINITKDGSIEY